MLIRRCLAEMLKEAPFPTDAMRGYINQKIKELYLRSTVI